LTQEYKPRVSVVSYLNTVPLIWGMQHGEQRELNRQKLDIIRGCGVACHGAVRSILLISKVPFAEIRTLATDSTSRTSVALSRIILSRKYGVEPKHWSQAPHIGKMLENADAALIIGDTALLLDPATLPFHVLDLGKEWTEMTGLPMVFAVWAARAGVPKQDPRSFTDSLHFGQDHMDDIVQEWHSKLRLSEALVREYLTRNIVFELGDREYAGLQTFLQYASELSALTEAKKVTV
jgi:predicted solute-binding protein